MEYKQNFANIRGCNCQELQEDFPLAPKIQRIFEKYLEMKFDFQDAIIDTNSALCSTAHSGTWEGECWQSYNDICISLKSDEGKYFSLSVEISVLEKFEKELNKE